MGEIKINLFDRAIYIHFHAEIFKNTDLIYKAISEVHLHVGY